MREIFLEPMPVLALSVGVLIASTAIKKRVDFLQRFCIPEPVVGGFLIAIIVWLLHSAGIAQVKFDTSLQTPLMVAFFTVVGLSGSLRLLKIGGATLIAYLACCWAMALFQNLIGIGMMKTLGLDPVLGVLSGAVSLEGGHGNAIAFGGMVDELRGTNSAQVLAVASATFGLISGSLLGGPVARYLIRRHRLSVEVAAVDDIDPLRHNDHRASHMQFLAALFCVSVVMVLGNYLAGWFKAATGTSLPAYVGAMLVAIVVRNLNDKFNFFTLNQYAIDIISELSLGIFLTIAMMNLAISELASMAAPLLLTLFVQVAALIAFAIFVVFRLAGRDYDAAIMCAGLMGHGLGATPNAVANMSAVCSQFGAVSRKAFLIVPLCGAVLIDIVAIPLNTYLINLFA